MRWRGDAISPRDYLGAFQNPRAIRQERENHRMKLTAEDLHRAADIVGAMGDDQTQIGEYGLPWEQLEAFVDGSDWHDVDEAGPRRTMDPLALAIGISIGVIAGRALDEARQ